VLSAALAPFIFDSSSAQEDVEDDPFSVEYLAPQMPGDPFYLGYVVPPGSLSAVIIMTETDAGEPAWEDYAGAVAIPIQSDPDTGLTSISGEIPESTDAEMLRASTLEFRIAILDPLTGSLSLSAPTPLVPKEEPSEDDSTEESDDAGLSATDLVSQSGENSGPGDDSEKSGSNNPSSGLLGKFGQSGKVIPLTLVSLTSSDFLFYVHDQPTPIHGSGH